MKSKGRTLQWLACLAGAAVLVGAGPLRAPRPAQAQTQPLPGQHPIAVKLLGELSRAARCGVPGNTSPFRLWCTAATGFARGVRAPLPARPYPTVGLTVGLSLDVPAEQSLARQVTLSSIGIAPSAGGAGHRGWITSVRPNAPKEQQEVAQAVFEVARVLKGGAGAPAIPPGLLGYLRTLPGRAKYALTPAPRGWIVESRARAELRRVGAYWVAVEVPPARPLRGVYVSIFTDRL